jgi:hypothetical protein
LLLCLKAKAAFIPGIFDDLYAFVAIPQQREAFTPLLRHKTP